MTTTGSAISSIIRSMRPVAALAENQKQLQLRLLELAPPGARRWNRRGNAATHDAIAAEPKSVGPLSGTEQFLILVTCQHET